MAGLRESGANGGLYQGSTQSPGAQLPSNVPMASDKTTVASNDAMTRGAVYMPLSPFIQLRRCASSRPYAGVSSDVIRFVE